MLELRRLLDAGYDVAFQPRDGTAADGSRSYECCMITPEGNGATACGATPSDALHLGRAGAEPSVEAYVDRLDGAERKVLLNHIAQAWPEVVEAGVELVARWREECAARRHAADKRKANVSSKKSTNE